MVMIYQRERCKSCERQELGNHISDDEADENQNGEEDLVTEGIFEKRETL